MYNEIEKQISKLIILTRYIRDEMNRIEDKLYEIREEIETKKEANA